MNLECLGIALVVLIGTITGAYLGIKHAISRLNDETQPLPLFPPPTQRPHIEYQTNNLFRLEPGKPHGKL